MAMTKEQQREAARRIMEKSPMTAEERETYNLLVKSPEEYVPPGPTGERLCGRCGATFEDTVDGKGVVVQTSLDKFSDHQSEHNHTPGQWATAHQNIQAGKEKSKAEDSQRQTS